MRQEERVGCFRNRQVHLRVGHSGRCQRTSFFRYRNSGPIVALEEIFHNHLFSHILENRATIHFTAGSEHKVCQPPLHSLDRAELCISHELRVIDNSAVRASQAARLQRLRAERDEEAAARCLRALTAAHEKEMAGQAARHEKELATTIDAMLGAPTLLQIAQSSVPLWSSDCGVVEQRRRRWRRRRPLPRRL